MTERSKRRIEALERREPGTSTAWARAARESLGEKLAALRTALDAGDPLPVDGEPHELDGAGSEIARRLDVLAGE